MAEKHHGDKTDTEESTFRQVFRNITTDGHARLHLGNSYVQYHVRASFLVSAILTFGIALLLATGTGSMEWLYRVDGDRQGRDATTRAPFMVPLSRHARHIPRTDISDRLSASEDHADHRRAVLYGMGGVGKTELAVHYAHDFYDRNPDVSVFWLRASTLEQFEDEYRKIGNFLKVKHGEKDASTEIDAIHEHLSDYRNGKWLIILDDLDGDPSDIATSFPSYIPQTQGCRVIVTTRDRNLGLAFTGTLAALIQVDILTSEEAHQMVTRGLRSELIVYRLVVNLTQSCSNLPLALSQAISYMNHFDTTLHHYMAFIASDPNLLLELRAPDSASRGARYFRNVRASFNTTFERLEQRHPVSARLLRVMSRHNPHQIFECLIRLSAFPDERTFREAIGILHALSLVHTIPHELEVWGFVLWDDEDETSRRPSHRVYEMHPLVRRAIRFEIEVNAWGGPEWWT